MIGLTLGPLAVAQSQAVDEGEFSPAMLGYRLQLVSGQFAQAERMLLKGGAAGSTLKQLARVHQEIECLKAELRCGWYYPDLLDEQIVITREKLRLILAAQLYRATFDGSQQSFNQLTDPRHAASKVKESWNVTVSDAAADGASVQHTGAD